MRQPPKQITGIKFSSCFEVQDWTMLGLMNASNKGQSRYYLNQYWQRLFMPYGITRTQWVQEKRYCWWWYWLLLLWLYPFFWLNILRLGQNDCHFPDDIFKYIFLNENVLILIEISLKFIFKCPINNNPVLVQIMAWCRTGNKPLSEPMMVRLSPYICITRPHWVKGHMIYIIER